MRAAVATNQHENAMSEQGGDKNTLAKIAKAAKKNQRFRSKGLKIYKYKF
jgi:hypothetical protein